jgi:hypothetical protein
MVLKQMKIWLSIIDRLTYCSSILIDLEIDRSTFCGKEIHAPNHLKSDF